MIATQHAYWTQSANTLILGLVHRHQCRCRFGISGRDERPTERTNEPTNKRLLDWLNNWVSEAVYARPSAGVEPRQWCFDAEKYQTIIWRTKFAQQWFHITMVSIRTLTNLTFIDVRSHYFFFTFTSPPHLSVLTDALNFACRMLLLLFFIFI